jgi:2,4-dienoyl-CoA reductase-like NADH-dependent reductase (Old Yellow Enzyme family)
MCQYSSVDGRPSDWHLVHLGSFARGGAGLVMSEATAVTPEGRISPQDAGIWNDEQAADYRRITDFVHGQGAVSGIQLAHAGRKASTRRPWDGRGFVPAAEGGWQTVGASPLGYADWPAPRELTAEELVAHPGAWGDAARRSLEAGFDVSEVNAAHGVPFATRIREASGLPVAAVGLITEPQQAEKIVRRRRGRRGVPGPRAAPRPALGASRRGGARCRHLLAGPVPPRASLTTVGARP